MHRKVAKKYLIGLLRDHFQGAERDGFKSGGASVPFWDLVAKLDVTDIQELQGLPTYIDESPDPLEGDQGVGLQYEVPKPSETDWSGLKVDIRRPNVTDDMVP